MTKEVEELNTLVDAYRSFITRYSYYIMALCVAAIGFSVTQSLEMKLSIHLIPLGVSVLYFCLSVLFGLKFINTITKGMTTEIIMKRIRLGYDEIAGNDIAMQKMSYESISKNIPRLSKNGTLYKNVQLWCFYLGVLSFILWRIIEMYQLTVITSQ